MSALASVSRLQQLHAKLASTPVLTRAMSYINQPSQAKYTPLFQGVLDFMAATSAEQTDLSNNILRIQIVMSDGVTMIDTSKDSYLDVTDADPSQAPVDKPLKNQHANVGKAITSGESLSWPLGENQNTRGYNMGATLSQSGVFVQQRRSNTTGENQLYMAVRMGTLNEPIGNVIISIKTN